MTIQTVKPKVFMDLQNKEIGAEIALINSMSTPAGMKLSLECMYRAYVESPMADDKDARTEITTDFHLLTRMISAVMEPQD